MDNEQKSLNLTKRLDAQELLLQKLTAQVKAYQSLQQQKAVSKATTNDQLPGQAPASFVPQPKSSPKDLSLHEPLLQEDSSTSSQSIAVVRVLFQRKTLCLEIVIHPY